MTIKTVDFHTINKRINELEVQKKAQIELILGVAKPNTLFGKETVPEENEHTVKTVFHLIEELREIEEQISKLKFIPVEIHTEI